METKLSAQHIDYFWLFHPSLIVSINNGRNLDHFFS